jgi:hypothetical protein
MLPWVDVHLCQVVCRDDSPKDDAIIIIAYLLWEFFPIILLLSTIATGMRASLRLLLAYLHTHVTNCRPSGQGQADCC